MTKCIEISLCGFIVTGKYPVRSPHFQSTKDCSEFVGNSGNRGFKTDDKRFCEIATFATDYNITS